MSFWNKRDGHKPPPTWPEVKNVVDVALEHEPELWPELLDQVCGGNEGLRQEVESLLRVSRDATDFIEEPAFDLLGERSDGPAKPGPK